MKRKVFNVKKFIVFIFVLCVIVLGILVGSYFYIVNSHGKSSDTVSIVINSGDTYNTIADKLKREGLIMLIPRTCPSTFQEKCSSMTDS